MTATLSRRTFTKAELREAQRVLDERPPLPPVEEAYNARRRADLRAMVTAELERRATGPRPGA